MGILPTVQAWDTATTEGQRTASFSTQPEEMGSCAATAPAPNTIPVPMGFLCLDWLKTEIWFQQGTKAHV